MKTNTKIFLGLGFLFALIVFGGMVFIRKKQATVMSAPVAKNVPIKSNTPVFFAPKLASNKKPAKTPANISEFLKHRYDMTPEQRAMGMTI